MWKRKVRGWLSPPFFPPSSKLAWFTVAVIAVFGFVVFRAQNYSAFLFTYPYMNTPVAYHGSPPGVLRQLESQKGTGDSRLAAAAEKINKGLHECNVTGDSRLTALVATEEEIGKGLPHESNVTGVSRLPALVTTEEEIDKGLHENNVTGDDERQNGISSDDTEDSRKSKRYTYTNMERIEADLARARASILRGGGGGTQTKDDDSVPVGPMYRNASFFLRSYAEMEKTLKVYVYEDGQPPVAHYGPCKSTYAIEGNFIHAMDFSRFRTTDPDKAHLYFLPFSITVLSKLVYEPNSHDWSPMKITALDYVNSVARKYPFWNRSLGADHFILSCHDWGPEISFAIPNLHNNSIRALCNANTSERFDPKKDVSIPEIVLPSGTTKGLLGGPSPSKRPVLVFYAGGLHGPVRPILLQHWENKDEDVQVHSYLPKGVSYNGMMRKSRYCICPSGYEVASPRMVEALYMGCVPVLIKRGYVAPFSDVLNWEAFAVIIPVEDIPNLKKILTGISQRQYIRMQRRGVKVRRHFEVNSPPKRFDVFHMILHSIWLRRLNVRLHHLNV
ncbi:PREDICTED: probable glycosyltransferase At5g03795 isoform X2 [Ipomoea nil]|uniref:probable glycosyltransferase At5g03795 isoform X2 n=1 Tax=Ipomoea nil TaxID=35883 RepID=UPI000901385C|nr:PREDICTED: probable glycosyltransferase At5g03795 isoform X2 [Ipomoea nil]